MISIITAVIDFPSGYIRLDPMKKMFKKCLQRFKNTLNNKEQIVIFYSVDLYLKPNKPCYELDNHFS